MSHLILELHHQGLIAPDIAHRLSIDVNRVRQTLHQANRVLHPTPERARADRRRLAIEDALTINPALTSRELAERLGVPVFQVTRYRRALGKPAPDRHEQAQRRRAAVAMDLLAGMSTRAIADKYGVKMYVIQNDRRLLEGGR